MEHDNLSCILEVALLTAPMPLSNADLRKMFVTPPEIAVLNAALEALRLAYDAAKRPVELIQLSSGWRFRARAAYMPYLLRLNPDKPPRYSRAVLETLAIIAYRQPVTRGDIEAIRGVTVNANALHALEERGWIDVVGHRETPGRPALYATTRQFLDDLGLRALGELPALSSLIPADFSLPETENDLPAPALPSGMTPVTEALSAKEGNTLSSASSNHMNKTLTEENDDDSATL
jgi:segregation and condensation protein B